MAKSKFITGDLIFAKIKGYSAWPAKILSIAEKKLLIFTVHFYGSRQEGICRINDFPHYDEYSKKKICQGKLTTNKSFFQAMEEIEKEQLNKKRRNINISGYSLRTNTHQTNALLVCNTPCNTSVNSTPSFCNYTIDIKERSTP